mmetsp:Transcript_26723/g.56287  ORF Transcript_26723/g.56287 Transcript_26723/m.56287 type:complete len:1040 (+) Transcript_26723:308-3427(+)|eukprot:CAMPEP_0171349362 /NCGR_PEP_ID=MMETSP0878-20121228/33501_1 /TAXON_ID=67004 /ORGANISM="Thalassiosira weissflogii, Strain CCMP1336" /LENGTH=1039 /DNA_ID=CAMNT_0011853997 /DNA_START=210 /DNA_END=3329 /DNA_ORIENTATION=-
MNAIDTTPKTPRHPSNGYEVLNDANGSDREDTPLKQPAFLASNRSESNRYRMMMSPSKRSLSSVLESCGEDEPDRIGVSSPLKNQVSLAKPSKSKPCISSIEAKRLAVIDQYSSNSKLAPNASFSKSSAGNDVLETPKKRTRKSLNTMDSTPVRRSPRIQAKLGDSPAVRHSLPASFSASKKAAAIVHGNANPNGNDIKDVNSGVESALFAEECLASEDEEGSSFKHPKRRRSLRIQAKMQAFEPTTAALSVEAKLKSPSPNLGMSKSKSYSPIRAALASASKATKPSKLPMKKRSGRPKNLAALPPRPPARTISTLRKNVIDPTRFTTKTTTTKVVELSYEGHKQLVSALEKIARESAIGTNNFSVESIVGKDDICEINLDVRSLMSEINPVACDEKTAEKVSILEENDGVSCDNLIEESAAKSHSKGSFATALLHNKPSPLNGIVAGNTDAEEGNTLINASPFVTVRKKTRCRTYGTSNRKSTAISTVYSATELSDDINGAAKVSDASSASSKASTACCDEIDLLPEQTSACKPDSGEREVLRKKLFETASSLDSDMANEETCSTEEGSFGGDEPSSDYASPRMVKRIRELSSDVIDECMRKIFSQFKVYNYPCVSARIFAAMSSVMPDEEFEPLLPLFSSLVNSEIISLQSKDEFRDVYFFKKKVCFSGFDYSSTVPAVDSISGSQMDLNSNIDALREVLREAQLVPRPMYYMGSAIQCLEEMSEHDNTSDACSKAMVGYFPSCRLDKAIKHYLAELRDIQSYLVSRDKINQTSQQSVSSSNHTGVRYRLGDFIGRSVRFHLRQLLNSIPEDIVDLDVQDCEERWGRAVADWSISSLFNFSLEKIDEFYAAHSAIFEDEQLTTPQFFTSHGSTCVLSVPRKEIKHIGNSVLEELQGDINEARAFLYGLRACRFVSELLQWPGIAEHIASVGGWEPIESVTSIFNELQLHKCVDNAHYVLLRNVDELKETLKKVVERCEESEDACEASIRKLRKKFLPRKRETSFCFKGTPVYAVRMSLQCELEEHFPAVVEYSAEI